MYRKWNLQQVPCKCWGCRGDHTLIKNIMRLLNELSCLKWNRQMKDKQQIKNNTWCTWNHHLSKAKYGSLAWYNLSYYSWYVLGIQNDWSNIMITIVLNPLIIFLFNLQFIGKIATLPVFCNLLNSYSTPMARLTVN